MNTKSDSPNDYQISITHPDIEKYLLGLRQTHRGTPHFTDNEIKVLKDMEEYAKKENFPIVGPLVGPFLAILAKMVQAKRIFEFGSGFGYSAFWFTRAFSGNGKEEIIMTDKDECNKKMAEEMLHSVGRHKCANFQVDWAQEVYRKTSGEFDIIYNDAHKKDYPNIWISAKNRLKSGGLYIADNTLWSGRVTQKIENIQVYKEQTEAISRHNEMIADDHQFEFFTNPTRDGVIVARKV